MMSYVIVVDTICEGWQSAVDEDGKPWVYATEAEAEREIKIDFEDLQRNRILDGEEPDEEPDEFVVPLEDYIKGRKLIWTPSGCHIEGEV